MTSAPLSAHDVRRLQLPLHLILWGALLVFFDLSYWRTTNGYGFRLDLLNDALGGALVSVGVGLLLAIRVHAAYAHAMTFVLVMAVIRAVVGLGSHVIVPDPSHVLGGLAEIVNLVNLVATAVFCLAMRWLCEHVRLDEAARTWSFALLLTVVLLVVPRACATVAGAIATIAGLTIDIGVVGVLLGLVMLVPYLAIVLGIVRTLRGARRRQMAGRFVRCPACAYDFRGHAGGVMRCPECGEWLTAPPEPPMPDEHLGREPA